MYALIGVNLLYLLIAYPLIYGRWGLPHMGLTGAGVAVGLAEGCWRLLSPLALPPSPEQEAAVTPRSLAIGLAHRRAGIRGTHVPAGRHHRLHEDVLLYVTVSYAAHQVGLSIESLSFLPGYGFAIAASTMVGQSIGAGKYVRAKLENWEANRLATVAMASMGVLF